jgi:hypothetical protein
MEPKKKVASPGSSSRLLKICSHRKAVLPKSLPKTNSAPLIELFVELKLKKWLHW